MDITDLVFKYEEMVASESKMYFDADEFIMLAEYYKMEDDFDEVDKIIEIAMEIHSGNPDLMLLYGEMLIVKVEFNEAIEYLNNLTESPDLSDDDKVNLSLLRIEAYLNINNFEAANEVLQVEYKNLSDPEEICEFLYNVSDLYMEHNHIHDARYLLERAIIIDSTDVKVLRALISALELTDEFKKAISINKKWIDLDPYSFKGWTNLGKLYMITELYQKAIEAFDFALTINDSDPVVLQMKSYALFFNNNIEGAIKTAEESLKIDSDNPDAYDTLMDCYHLMGQFDKMFEVIDAKELKFGSYGIAVMKAQTYFDMKEYDKALELFSNIPSDEKDTYEYYVLEGDICFYNDDMDGAISAFLKVIEDDPECEKAYDKIAEAYMKKENYIEAANYLEQLIDLAPDYIDANRNLAFARFEIGEKEPFDEALQELTDKELNSLLVSLTGNDKYKDNPLDRETLIKRLDEARENRNLFKNLMY